MKLILTETEKREKVWQKLMEYWTYKLNLLRVSNDDAALGEFDTAFLRGKIACLKEMMNLDKAPPIVD